MDVLLGGLLAIIGGFVGVWYQSVVSARAAKGDRLRDISRPMLAATRKANTFAERKLDDLFDASGGMHPNLRELEIKQVSELLDELTTAQESASQLEFETDNVSARLRHLFSTLHGALFLYRWELQKPVASNVMTRDKSSADKQKIKQLCFSLRFFLIGHIAELERSPLEVARRKAKRQWKRFRWAVYMWRLRWRLRLLAWRKGKRLTPIMERVTAKSQVETDDTDVSDAA